MLSRSHSPLPRIHAHLTPFPANAGETRHRVCHSPLPRIHAHLTTISGPGEWTWNTCHSPLPRIHAHLTQSWMVIGASLFLLSQSPSEDSCSSDTEVPPTPTEVPPTSQSPSEDSCSSDCGDIRTIPDSTQSHSPLPRIHAHLTSCGWGGRRSTEYVTVPFRGFMLI